MKLTKLSAALGLTLFASISSSFVFAEDEGWYIGGNIGQSKADLDEAEITEDVIGTGFTTTDIDTDSRDRGYKLYGGYQFNRHIALEAGYADLGKFNFTSTTLPAGTLGGAIKLKGVYVDLVGIAPLSEKLSAFARVGVNYTKAEDSFSGTGAVTTFDANASDRNSNVKFGVGLQYAFNPSWALRLEAERYRIDDAVGNKGNVDLISLGLLYRFGAHKPAPVAVAPAPTVVTPPPAPRIENYTLSSTTLFNFDQAEIGTPPAELEQITTALQGNAEPKQIVIRGYTDRLGSDEYNQKLSERRALAVKTYLVDKGVNADRLVTEGKGEKDPVVECKEKDRTALINCLQPNRRVKIDDLQLTREVKSNP